MKNIEQLKNEWYESNVKGMEKYWDDEEIQEQYALIEEAEKMITESLTSDILKIRNAANLKHRMSIEANIGFIIMNTTAEFLFKNGGSDEDNAYLSNILKSKSISVEGAEKFAAMILDNADLKLKVYKAIK